MTEKKDGLSPRPDWILAALRSHPLLATLTAPALAMLASTARVQTVRVKRTFLREGAVADTVHFLLAGTVRVHHRAEDGSEVLLKLLKAPAMFGEVEVIAGSPYAENVTTLTECQLLPLPGEAFRQLLKRDPSFSAAVLDDVATRFCVAVANIKALAFSDVQRRLAAVLLDYAALGSQTDADTIAIEARVSQESLARDLAVSRKAVQHALAELQRQGCVERQSSRYVITNSSALEVIAGMRPRLTYSSRGG